MIMAKTFDELANRTMSAEARARAAHRTRAILAEMVLAEVRRQAGKSQSELARVLGIKQPSLSKLEGQADMQISTLQRIIEALGGRVEIIARFPKSAVRLAQFHARAHRPSNRPRKAHTKSTPKRARGARELQLI
jgi:transcriptional regulator with XRE-family HTH domain